MYIARGFKCLHSITQQEVCGFLSISLRNFFIGVQQYIFHWDQTWPKQNQMKLCTKKVLYYNTRLSNHSQFRGENMKRSLSYKYQSAKLNLFQVTWPLTDPLCSTQPIHRHVLRRPLRVKSIPTLKKTYESKQMGWAVKEWNLIITCLHE